jgi:hypothetical protein
MRAENKRGRPSGTAVMTTEMAFFTDSEVRGRGDSKEIVIAHKGANWSSLLVSYGGGLWMDPQVLPSQSHGGCLALFNVARCVLKRTSVLPV